VLPQAFSIDVTLVCLVPFGKQPVRGQITDLINPMIDQVIALVVAGTLLVDQALGLGNVPDTLPHLIIRLLRCQGALILPNPHGFCYLWLTPIPAFFAQTQTCRDAIWIVLLSVKCDFIN